MLRNLYVKNLALIDEINIDFDEGLTVLSGETGAGKSIVLGAISIALGLKISGDIVRDDKEDAIAQLGFYFDDPSFLQHLPDTDIEVDDEGELIIRRVISGGRSRYKINGCDVSSSQVKKIAPLLLDLHAQRDSLLLLKEKEQLSLVDKVFEKETKELIAEISEKLKERNEIRARLSELGADESERERELDLLKFEAEELTEAQLQHGEDDELEESFRRYENSDKIKRNALSALGVLSDDKASASLFISSAIKEIEEMGELIKDETVKNITDMLYDADSIISDCIHEISAFSDSTDADEDELRRISERLNIYNKLKGKYHTDTDGLIDLLEKKEKRIYELENAAGLQSECNERIAVLENEMNAVCEKLTKIRKKAAGILAADIADAAKELNFNDVNFAIDITNTGEFTSNGDNKAEFMISVNPGESLKPLKDVASGGELSRIMLAIKTVTADMDNTGTLIFDEIDTGISGRTAQMTAQRMAVLAGKRQIICITHLPQIASMADHHFLIEKTVTAGRSITNILPLDETARVSELSRLLGGTQITDNVKKNAEEMITFAKEYKINNR